MKSCVVNSCLFVGAIFFLACSCQSTLESKTDVAKKIDPGIGVQKPLTDSSSKQFSKTLSLQGMTYQVTATGNGSLQQLVIIPSGLSTIKDTIQQTTDPVVGAEVEDLDRDGFPELLIYTQSAGSGSYGQVIAFSPNKGKSISPINFPALVQGSKESKGYMGHDRFSMVESSLSRRFPVYETNDSNATPTGKIRQLQYQLKNGEASKQFVLVGSMEFDQ